MRHPAFLCPLAFTVAVGCSPNETADDPAPDTIRASAADVPPSPWYRRTRALDLTGDGQLDTVRLEASGARPDSLSITLSLVVDGAENDGERWTSADELTLLDSAARARAGIDVVMRAQLDSVLASVLVQRLDAPGVRLMAEDTAVLARLDPRPADRVSFSYGYETTVRLVWDAPRKRFVRLFTCC